MGLLAKTLKKTGQERKSEVKPDRPNEQKPAVEWLGRTFSERTRALADKIDLESQYAKLTELTETAHVPPPPKSSLRERAKRFLNALGPTAVLQRQEQDASHPKMSLRQRAALLVRKLTNSGEGSSGTSTSTSSAPIASGGASEDSNALAGEVDANVHLPLFPWHTLSDDGALVSHIAFGEAEPIAQQATVPTPNAADAEPSAAPQVPLAAFADTMERISENLRNLHVQLDSGRFIRDLQIEGQRAHIPKRSAPLLSHHVSIDDESQARTPRAQTSAEAQPFGQAPEADRVDAPLAHPKDIFWPRSLPLDLPARDIKLNADGTISVVPGPFQLPYLAEDIAPATSELSHFTRNLKNAELFIAEGELQLTRIIYERLLLKIVDDEAKRKIRANLEALDKYKQAHSLGNFMPISPSQRNPWNEAQPPRVNVGEMPVEAKNITINLDKGFFEIAKALFEMKKSAEGYSSKDKASTPGDVDEAEDIPDSEETKAEDDSENRTHGTEEQETADQRKGDRRQGAADPRGEGAVDRRSGEDRREALEENTPPAPLGADGQAAAPEEPPADGVIEPPKIPEMSPDGQAMAPGGGDEDGGSNDDKEEENKVQEIRGVLELKTPDQEDTPFLTLTYDFTKIPHAYRLAKDNGIFEYAYYKYKPMLVKAHQFIKRKQITRALNYYRVIREQQIPSEFRHMVDRNIKDITEYLQKYLVTRAS